MLDDQGATCRDSVIYTVGSPPSLSIIAPSTGNLYDEGSAMAFSAVVSDGEDGPEELAISWESDLDGVFNTDTADSTGQISFFESDLQFGEHVLTATVTDTDGLYASESIAVTVNGLPTAPAVSLAPDPAYTDDTLPCTPSFVTDDDPDTHTFTTSWTVGGADAGVATTTLPSSAFTRDHPP